MIHFDNVYFGYTSEHMIFNGLTLVIPKGSRIHITGPSGAGKTTFLRLVMGLEKPLSGKIECNARRIAPVFQEDRLVESWSGLKNISLGNPTQNEKIAQMLGIEDLLNKQINELSGGEKRRIALCRALNHNGDLIILDEPFNGIDDNNLENCIRAIDCIANDSTLLLVTHQQYQADLLNCKNVRIV